MNGLRCIRSKNGKAKTSAITIRHAASNAPPSLPSSEYSASSGMNFSNPNSCPTAITTSTPAYAQATLRAATLRGCTAFCALASFIPLVYAPHSPVTLFFSSYYLRFCQRPCILCTAKVTKTNIQLQKTVPQGAKKYVVTDRSTISTTTRDASAQAEVFSLPIFSLHDQKPAFTGGFATFQPSTSSLRAIWR